MFLTAHLNSALEQLEETEGLAHTENMQDSRLIESFDKGGEIHIYLRCHVIV